MKKLIALLLVLTMAVSMAACGPKNNETKPKPTDAKPTNTQPTNPKPTTPANNDVIPTVDAATVGGKLWAAFTAAQAATAFDMATELIGDPAIAPIGCMALEIEPGLLTGFDNYEVKGFEAGAMFAPMIGSYPFVGYIFDLAEGADVAAFVKELQDNSNRRWNICTEADQTVVGSKGNQVFFVMCPNVIEDEGGGEDNPDLDTIEPTVTEGTLGHMLWLSFINAAPTMVSESAVDMAAYLAFDPVLELLGCFANPVEPGLLTGFDNYEVKGFESGAMFCPMISSQPFVGYIFDLAEGADVAAFIQELENNSNRRWNVCVEADQTVVGAYGNRVFFVMCPNAIEE